jgi:hypothetical protein
MVLQNEKCLLFIEPTKEEKLLEPINDDLTELMQYALKHHAAEGGVSIDGTFEEGLTFRGFHTSPCGEATSSKDYLLENGMATNSMAVFYLQWYRNSIPQAEIEKLKDLAAYYNTEINWDEAFNTAETPAQTFGDDDGDDDLFSPDDLLDFANEF